MRCNRCHGTEVTPTGWCAACETAYDAWSRRHASDIIVSVLGGTLVVCIAGVVLPLLGLGWVIATTAAAGAGATILGLHRAAWRRRRRQFLATALPRAYLP